MRKIIFLLTILSVIALSACTRDEEHVKHIQIIQKEPTYIIEAAN